MPNRSVAYRWGPDYPGPDSINGPTGNQVQIQFHLVAKAAQK
jgi:hypothetical protein